MDFLSWTFLVLSAQLIQSELCFLGAGNVVCKSQPSSECFTESFPNTAFHLWRKKMPAFNFCLLIFS